MLDLTAPRTVRHRGANEVGSGKPGMSVEQRFPFVYAALIFVLVLGGWGIHALVAGHAAAPTAAAARSGAGQRDSGPLSNTAAPLGQAAAPPAQATEPTPTATRSGTAAPAQATAPTPAPASSAAPAPSAAAPARSAGPASSAGQGLAGCTQPGQPTVTGATNPTVRATIGTPSGDMAPAIQGAINRASAAGGGIVALGPGSYRLGSRLTMATGVELAGSGEDGTTLQIETPDTGVITTGGASDTTIADLTVDQNGQHLSSASGGGNPAYYEVMIDGGTNNIVERVRLVNPVNYMLDEDDDASAFCVRDSAMLVNGAESKYRDNAYAHLDGIHIDGGSNGDILGNYVDERENGATDGDDALVAQSYTANQSHVAFVGNVARGGNNGDCLQFALGPDSIADDTVSGNELWGCPFGVRTGGYAPGGSITGTTVAGNNIHNLVAGQGDSGSFPGGGEAIELGGFLTSGQSAGSDSVTGNFVCSAGSVVPESGVSIAGTVHYAGCGDAATTSSGSPRMP